jgi:hypothetical protein
VIKSPELVPARDIGVHKGMSALELLHPDGVAGRSAVIGNNAPERLVPDVESSREGPQNLILVAPTETESSSPMWIEHAISQVARTLQADGFAYFLVPRRTRIRLRRMARHYGLVVESGWIHRPDQPTSRYLVPLQTYSLRLALFSLAPLSLTHQRLLALALSVPAVKSLLPFMLPSVGLIVRRPGARPLLEWFGRIGDSAHEPGSAILKTRPLHRPQIATLIGIDPSRGSPSVIAKVGLNKSATMQCEELAGRSLRCSEAAIKAGGVVPISRVDRASHLNTVVVQSPVPGEPATNLLISGRYTLRDMQRIVSEWLVSWNRGTCVREPIDDDWLEAEILEPVRRLSLHCDFGHQYLEWLTQLCEAASGRIVPKVTTHNDLSVENILIDRDGRIGIIDWELSRERDLPLMDFIFATASITGTRRSITWSQAVRESFSPNGKHSECIARLGLRLIDVIGLPTDLMDLCFHACWIRSADWYRREWQDGRRTDSNQAIPPQYRPLIDVVKWLAAEQLSLSHWDRLKPRSMTEESQDSEE